MFLTRVLLCVCFLGCLQGDEEIKQEIILCQKNIEKQPHKGPLLAKLAILYLKDQNQEQAFITFLQALQESEKGKIQTSLEDESFYREALQVYLDHSTGSPQMNAQKILTDYSGVMTKHPQAFLLGFIVSAAYANLGKYEDFMQLFYTCYQKDPDHYLAHKTQSVLYAKLYERAPNGEAREKYRLVLLEHLDLAIQRFPTDDSLYKLQLSFVSENKKAEMVLVTLNKIIHENIIIPRGDISFYVAKAVEANQLPLAQKFVDKAREWYQYSRVVSNAQAYLNSKSNEESWKRAH